LGLSLIAFWLFEPANWVIILEVAVGLGMVIFVHELGHFAVAKACGVKCEKFFLGFDIYGLKLFSRQWGETEYGIGILPLGGYVKMLGQDDNPSRAADERERTLQGQEAIDPRSYPAQSVPKRMAIISAGVIMNVIFAFVLAAVAYALGLKETPCAVGGVMPGQAAWKAGVRTGDVIREIGDRPVTRFRDLMNDVILSSGTVRFVIDRPGVKEPITLQITPHDMNGRPAIGVASPWTTTLRDEDPLFPVWDKALAGKLQADDKIVAVDGQAVESYAQLKAALDRHVAQAVTLSIVRQEKDKHQKAAHDSTLTESLPPRPMLDLGLVMRMGEISALRDGSPAEAAGVRVGDRLTAVDGQPIGDPLELPQKLAAKAGKTVTLTLERGGQKVELSVKQLAEFTFEQTRGENDPVGVPTLGLAYRVESRVAAVGPLAEGKLKPGDRILWAKVAEAPVKPTPGKAKDAKPEELPGFKIDFEKANWPLFFFSGLQNRPVGTEVELGLEGDRTVKIASAPATDWFNPDRGLRFQGASYTRAAQSFGDDMALATRETKESVGQVYGFLRQLFAGRISANNFGGPFTIAAVAGASASTGFSELLRFLCMLSANLAVLNFLPIPVLDGGHMVFLIMEGIRGKPVSERVVVAFHYAGFVFIICLMLFVIKLDIFRLLDRLGVFSG
jgi:regulator of sigma E protease